MSRDYNDISKEILKSNKQLNDMDKNLSKDIEILSKEIVNLKKDFKTLHIKIDHILDVLNTLTVFIVDEGEDLDDSDNEEYQSNEGWLPEVNNWEENLDDEEDE